MKKAMEIQIREKLREKLVLLPDFAVDYLYLLENSKEVQTRFEYAKDISLFLEFLLYSHKCTKSTIRDIEPSDIDRLVDRDLIDFFDYLTSYTKTYHSPTGKEVVQVFTNAPVGKARKLATLRKLFAHLFMKKLISKDITPNIEIKIPSKVKVKQRLTPEEIQNLFTTIVEDVAIEGQRLLKFHEKVKFRDYIMTLLLAYTGIRISELVQLDIPDIQLQKQTIVVTRKGGDEQEITMPERIIEDIKSFINHRKNLTDVHKRDQNALFISLHKKRIDPKTVRALLEKYRSRSEISTRITPHIFRRTFGTNHYNTYEDMYLTAQVLGHASAETTRKFYADPSEERVNRSMKQFDYQKNDPVENTGKLEKLAEKLGISLEELKRELG
ncbi:tyrosine-type recombinase/integrase [Brevibacillus sp. NPDC058079]|uniref:tyrosine-type recombinase/integrase n=1 Tax=Brevibacillus sp. NPDC058079 TaxID=3346330 RepID=UPI0036F0ABB7